MSVKGSAAAESAASGETGGPASGRRRTRNPQGQGLRLRADLIAAADRLLARTGDLEGLSLRAVAREVGIATPSIYLHFPDKSALVLAVLSARFAELTEAVQAAVSRATGPAERLRAGCRAYCQFATEHPNAYRVLFGRLPALTPRPPLPTVREGEAGAPVDAAVPTVLASQAGAVAFAVLIDGVSACMQAGVAPADDPFRVATNVWTALHGIVSLRGALPAFPWPPLDRQLDDVLAGLVGLHHNPPSSEG
jgi:AcrR family transcriptional regulator